MDVTCKNCGVGLEVDDAQNGQLETCPACNQVFEVPLLTGAAAERAKTPPPEFTPMEPAPLKLNMGIGGGVRGGSIPSGNRRGSGGNVASALASFVIPGLGQLAQGRMVPAVFFFLLMVCVGGIFAAIFEFPAPWVAAGVVAIASAVEAAVWDGVS